MSKKTAPVLLGSREAFDLRSVPFSRHGSYLCILEDPGDRSLYLSITRSHSMFLERKNLIRIVPVLDNKELAYEYEVTPGKLTLTTFNGRIEFTFGAERQLRVRGDGVNLRLDFKVMQYESACPRENGDWEVVYTILGKLLIAPLRGALWCGAKWVPHKVRVEDFALDFIATGKDGFEAAIHEYYSNLVRDPSYAAFDECVQMCEKDFCEYSKRFRPVPAKYEDMARRAAWTVWTHTMRQEGRLKRPYVYLSRQSIIRAFGWQQSYQAMAAVGDARAAWDHLLSIFEYQNEAGQIPDYAGDIGLGYMVAKPAVQGLALLYILDYADEKQLTREDYASAYDKLSRFADWWLNKRDRNRSGIPQYYHADESGFDDATIFRKGVPLMSGDLLAWLALLTEACGVLANKLSMHDKASAWAQLSQNFISVLVSDFWNGKQFISRVAADGTTVEEASILSLLPIILGKRLPGPIIKAIASRLEDKKLYFTDGGLVSEALNSPYFKIEGGFARGNIVAPMQLLFVTGLKYAGMDELAAKIAGNYLDFLCQKGLCAMLSPYDTDLATGLPIRKEDRYDPDDIDKNESLFKAEIKEEETVNAWSSWAAAVFLAIAGGIKQG